MDREACVLLSMGLQRVRYDWIERLNWTDKSPFLLPGMVLNSLHTILWPHDVKSHLIRKGLHAGEDWGQAEKGITEDEMVEWRHHWLNRQEFEQTLGDGEGQGSLAAHGVVESSVTKWLNNKCVNRIVSLFLKKKSPLIYHKIMHVWGLIFKENIVEPIQSCFYA